jgi:hypothetical protein
MTDDIPNADIDSLIDANRPDVAPRSAGPPMVKSLALGLGIAALLGWGINAYPPFRFEIPGELLQVNMYSPPAEQQRFKVESDKAYWLNGSLHFGLIGLAFGLVPAAVTRGDGQGRRLAINAILGLVAGCLGFAAAVFLRRFCDSGVELPVIGSLNGMLADTLVFVLLGVALCLPVMIPLLRSSHAEIKSKAAALPLGALLSGLAFPIAASILFPTQSTRDLPILHNGMLAVWLAFFALSLMLIFVLAGEKKR